MKRRLLVFLLILAMVLSLPATPALGAVPTNYRYGDIDWSGSVDAADALMVLQVAVELVFLDDADCLLGDVSGDLYTKGYCQLDASDALLILQYAVKKIEVFPVVRYKEEAKLPPSDTIHINQLQTGKSYQAIPTLQFEFDSKVSAYQYVQGGCYVNGEFYAAFIWHSDCTPGNHKDFAMIHVYDKDGNYLRHSPSLNVDHANNITYNPTLEKLVVTHCEGDVYEDYYTYSLVDPITFEITKTEVKDFPFFAMAYSPEKQQYASGEWSGQVIDICDKDMNRIHSYSVATPGSLSQGVFADGQYIYFVRSSQNGYNSELLIYDWEGKLIFQIPIVSMEGTNIEPENITIVDGVAYIMCNNHSGLHRGQCYVLTFR